ncbi:MAG: DUF2804 domain-containing protein [Propionibacterium sp.]|nr:DUF2804 domain-containing protein [Propionibacterium sp.]
MRVAEREITEAISLTRSDGTLNPDAVGWTRTPIINTDGIASGLRGLGRNKRWEYWAVTTPSHIVAFTISHVDYACVLGMWALDRATGETVAVDAVVPPASGVELPGTLGQGRAYARTKNLLLRVDEVPSGSRLRVMTDRVSFDIVAHLPAGHESLGVVVPWTDNLFQYTVKDVARPATGTIWFDGATHDVSKGAFATLDHGRGRWPYKVSWNWGAGSGVVGRKRVGIQVGGQWTDRTGSVENAFFVDGRMHKISQELLWDYSPEDWMRPWRVTGDGVDLLFTPFHVREAKTDVKVFSSETYQCFGEWSGSVEADGGSIAFEGLTGWVEDVHNRW